MRLQVLALLISLFSIHAQAVELNCAQYSSKVLGREVRYCIDRSTPDVPAEPGEPVVYFMHGTHGSARTWIKNNYAHSLDELRDKQELKPITYISFDTSAYSFYSDHPVKAGSKDTSEAYETWFVTEFIPYIEKTYNVCSIRACRGIMGESMGGFGALKTALRHPELFSTIAVNSPALSPFETKETSSDWVRFFSTKRVGPAIGILVTSMFFSLFPTEESFDENNPTHLVQNYDSTYPFPNLYFDMGGKDNYGFYVGYGLLKEALDQKKFQYTTDFEPSGHHDMWKRHASDSILFMEDHLGPAAAPFGN
jgi:S-formylglutathione hydrolase FrmB